ncbi:hypothetical protein [Enhygromyxa salina]|uniref:hypothetical protein n=1 Tax=Enhygromyxa salina TaxID=215803 RepID=UPI0011BAAA7F|nr:hypothetical protein [Enhygromyxa salina]
MNSANEVLRLFAGQTCDLVLDVADMTGYDRGARQAWQGLLWDHRGLIRRIVMVGADAGVETTGRVIARHLGVPLSMVPGDRSVDADAPALPLRSSSCAHTSISGQDPTPMHDR